MTTKQDIEALREAAINNDRKVTRAGLAWQAAGGSTIGLTKLERLEDESDRLWALAHAAQRRRTDERAAEMTAA